MDMNSIAKLSGKKKKFVVGLMSGTSLDGVDAALVEITGRGTGTKLNQLGFITFPFPKGLKKKLLENSAVNGGNVTDICRLNFLLALIYVDAVKSLCKRYKVPLSKIDLIGSHGQTIHHLPKKSEIYRYSFGSTLQIGDPSVIAKHTGILTVGDFRTGDIALGGEGAPLVPYFDYLLFYSNKVNRGLLNIGGIANITVLNKKSDSSDTIAFDTGPGNMMIDTLTKKFFKMEFDKGGRIASSGKINERLFAALKRRDKFIEKKPPKSTGREYYSIDFISSLFKEFNRIDKKDWITTITDFTAYSVFRNYEKFIKADTVVEELYVSGGGARNNFLVKSLKKYFGSGVNVQNVKNIGIPSDSKEALCFAVLANETISGNPSNVPKVTGAARRTILGKICLP